MPDPMYRQIADDLRQKIESGALAPGAQLPTELELREQYNSASRNTVRDAMKWLKTRGLVENRPGQGTFVVEKIDPYVTTLTGDPDAGRDDEGPVYVAEIEATLRTPASTAPRVEIQQAAEIVAEAADARRVSRQPPSAALHRWHSLVAADLVLSHEPGGTGRDAAHTGAEHR